MVLAADLPPQSTASGPKIKFFCVLPERAHLVHETRFDLLTCYGGKSHGNVLGDAEDLEMAVRLGIGAFHPEALGSKPAASGAMV